MRALPAGARRVDDPPVEAIVDNRQAIAIVGMACRFPGSRDVSAFWRNLTAGVESIRVFTDAELSAAGVSEAMRRDPRYVPAAGALEDVDKFDAPFFGFTPREAEITDPQQRVFLECAWEAMEAGGYRPGRESGRVGVFAGAGISTYLINNLLHRPDVLANSGDLELLMANNKDYVPTRVAYKLDLNGPAVNSNTACSTGLVNVHLAAQSLLAFECDMALAGGVSIQVPQDRGYLYESDGILSPDGHCRAFDARAGGTVNGNGVGIVLLKRLDEAIADRDHIHAVIIGTAMNNDGADKAGFTAPSVSGQSDAIAQALAMADVPADTIGYVETHGTGTPVGDPIELAALTQAFRARTAKTGFCAIGSVKTNIGHTDEAAGVAGLIKAALAVEHGEIPPSLHFETPNPALDLEATPFYVNAALQPWPASDQPRRAGVSSFGLGGTNVHMVIEQPPVPAVSASRPCQLIALSARSAPALRLASARLADALEQSPSINLADAAFTLMAGRRRFPHRRIIVAADLTEASRLLRGDSPDRVIDDHDTGTRPRDVVFMFSGHGAQYVGMGRGLYQAEPVFREWLDRCADIARPHVGLDIREAIFGDEGALRRMAVAQPAVFALQYALAQLWIAWGINPVAMIGHSAGEYVAACIAGTFTLDGALALMAERGRLLDSMAPGTMLAVALSERDVVPRLGGRVDLAVVTAPGMCVVAGERADVDLFRVRAEADGIDCWPVNVDVASHSVLMEPAVDPLRAVAARTPMQPPRVPFMSNLTGTWISDAEATSANYWAAHLRATVRFGDGIAALAAKFPRVCFLEIGPGRSLQSPVLRHPARQADQPVLASLRHSADETDDERFLLTTLGRLWAAGADVDASKMFAHEQRGRVPLPAYPFERQRYWITPGVPARPSTPVTGKRANVGDWIYLPSWKRSLTPPRYDGAAPRRFAVIGGDVMLSAEVVSGLRREGHAVVELRADGVDDRTIASVDEVVDFRSCATPGDGPRAAALLAALVATAQSMIRRPDASPVVLTLVLRGAHDVSGAEALDPDRAVLLGGVQAIEQEYPHIRCRAIDVELAASTGAHAVAGRLVAELRGFGSGRLIALRGRHRWSRAYEPQPDAGTPAPRLRERGVYLITGGIGDVGLVIAEYLARTVQARLVLTSRSRALTPEQIDAIKTAGGEVFVRHGDVADETRMREIVDESEHRFGPINGVFHAAGVTAPDVLLRSVPDTSADQIQSLFGPKVHGTRVLERVLRGRAVDFCVLISSNASTIGGLGLCAYSAASHFLDAFAAGCRRRGLPWTSTNWDGWPSAIEPLESGRTHLETYAMTRDEAGQALSRVLSLDAERIVVSSGDLSVRLDRWQRGDDTPPAATLPSDDADEPQRAEHLGDFVAPAGDVERAIATTFEDLLGVRPVGRHDSFFDLGGDSLLGSRVTARLARSLRAELSIKTLFAGPTVAQLAAAVSAKSGDSDASASIPKLAEQPSYETSHAQRRLWILQQMELGSAAYHIPLHQLLDGPLDLAALTKAIQALVQRHESLRTTFIAVEGEPRQVVHESPTFDIGVRDVSGTTDPFAAAQKFAREQTIAPFDLERGPLLRAMVVRLAPERHALLLTVHHIVADGVSIAAVAGDLASLYDAAHAGRPAVLAPLKIQYRDFAAWQNARLEGSRGRLHRDYWHAQLAGALPVLNLIEDLPRPPVLSSNGHELVFEIPAQISAALVDVGRARGASLFMVLVAGVNALLHRYTGDEDIIVGSPSAGRRHVDLDGQVGFFLNTLALRTRVDSSVPFDALLDRVRDAAIEAYEHEDYPFERLVHELHVNRDTSRSPLFDVMVILQNQVADTVAFGDIAARPFSEHSGTSRLDLSFNFKVSGGALILGLEYNTDLFVEERIRSMADHLQALLTAVVDAPATPVGQLQLLSAAERERVLIEFNATSRPYASNRAVVDLFEERARSSPEAVAVRHRDRTLTYRELDARSNQLARHFESHGCGAGDSVVLAVPSGFDMLAALLAILKLRGATVLAEPSVQVARLTKMLAGSGSRLLIAGVKPEALAFEGTIVELERDAPVIGSLSGDAVDVANRSGDDTALIFFTSGSTGRPNAVPLTNRAIVNELDWFARFFEVGSGDVIPQKTVLTFVDCIVELLLPITVGGGCVDLRPEHDTARDFAALSDWFRAIRPTLLQFVPAVFEEFTADGDGRSLESVRALVLSGGAVTHQPSLPFRTYNLYGCSEGTSLSTYFEMTEPVRLARVPIGKPLQNTSVYVLDAALEPCPMFVPGEIYIGGDMVSTGYLGDAELTEERFIASPFKTGARLFRTGDFGRWCAGGNLDYLGRRDDQVKVRGLRIECGEVEHALRSHTAVREAVVVGKPAGGDVILAAYVTARPGAVLDADQLRAHASALLPDYMIPASFVSLSEFPRTSSGKIDRRSLPEPVLREHRDAAAAVAPRTASESAIAAIWCDVLGLTTVGVHDDFLRLGGHSLKAARVVARMHRELSLNVALVDLFRHPTIAELAALAGTRGPAAVDEIRPVDDVDAIAPLTADELELLGD
jgi:iturin family lipopeptide synthetase A